MFCICLIVQHAMLPDAALCRAVQCYSTTAPPFLIWSSLQSHDIPNADGSPE